MSKGDRYREQVLDEAFFGEQIPWTDRAASFRVSLHTAEPQDEHGRLTAQIAYRGYTPIDLPRDRKNWQREGNLTTNLQEARFALFQAGTRVVATHWAITPAGFDTPAYTGQFKKPLEITLGIRPVIDAGMIEVREA